jgi:hypothetical protein
MVGRMCSSSMGRGNYYPTVLGQDPVAQTDSAVGAINTAIPIAVLSEMIG